METKPASVLVIENHALMREALCAAIASDPQLTISAPEANIATRAIIPLQPGVVLLAFRPDIVLFALGNPGADDLEALAVLHTCLPCTPILALTSADVEGQAQAALKAGAQAALDKSAPRGELLGKLKELRAQRAERKPRNIRTPLRRSRAAATSNLMS